MRANLLTISRILLLILLCFSGMEGMAQEQLNVQVFNQTNTPALPTNVFQRIEVDGKGHVWTGTNGQGVVKINPFTDKTDSIALVAVSTHQIRAIIRDSEGNIWVGSGAGGIRATGGGVRKFPQGKTDVVAAWTSGLGLASNYINGLAEAANGGIWAAHGQQLEGDKTNEGGIGVYDGETWRRLFNTNLPQSDIRVISVAKVGNKIWAGVDRSCGTPGNCVVPTIIEFEEFSVIGGTGSRIVSGGLSQLNATGIPRSIFYDSARELTWVGLSTGDGVVAVYEAGSWNLLSSEITKLPPNTTINFSSITKDEGGNIWIGTSNGLLKFNGDDYKDPANYKLYTTENGLPVNFINGLTVDSNDDIWLATSAGVAKVSLKLNMSVVNVTADVIKGENILTPIKDVEVRIYDGNNLVDKALSRDDGKFSFTKSLDSKKSYRLELTTGEETTDRMVLNIQNVSIDKIGQIKFPQALREQVREDNGNLSEFEIKSKAFTESLSFPIKIRGYVDEANSISSVINKDWVEIDELTVKTDRTLEAMNRVLLGQYMTEQYFHESNRLTEELLSFTLEFSKSLLDLSSFTKKTNVELAEKAKNIQKKINNNEYPSFIEKENAAKQLLQYNGAIIAGRIALKTTLKIYKEDFVNTAIARFGDSRLMRITLDEIFSLLYQVVDNYDPLAPDDSAWKIIEAKVKEIIMYQGAKLLNTNYYIPQTTEYVRDFVEHAQSNKESAKSFSVAAAAANEQLETTKGDVSATISRGKILKEASKVTSTAASIGETVAPLLVLGSGGLITPFASGLYATSKAMKAISILSLGTAFFTYAYRYTQVPDELKLGINRGLERKSNNSGSATYDMEGLEVAILALNDSMQLLKENLHANNLERVAANALTLGKTVEHLEKEMAEARGYLYAVAPGAFKSVSGFEDVYNATVDALANHDISKLVVSSQLTSYLIDPGTAEYRESLLMEIDTLVLNNNFLLKVIEDVLEKTSTVKSDAFVMVIEVLHPDAILLNTKFAVTLKYKNYGGASSSGFTVSLKPSEDVSVNNPTFDVPALGAGEEGTITFEVNASDELSTNPTVIVSFQGVDSFSETIVFQSNAAVFTKNNCYTPTPDITVSDAVLTSSSSIGNQWFLNGTAIAGATASTYTATETGRYTVQVTGSCGVSAMSEAVTLTITSAEEDLSKSFLIYPNPAHDKVTVEMQKGLQWKSIVLYSAHGKSVLQVEGRSEDSVTLEVKHLPKGLYVLQIQTDKGMISRKVILD